MNMIIIMIIIMLIMLIMMILLLLLIIVIIMITIALLANSRRAAHGKSASFLSQHTDIITDGQSPIMIWLHYKPILILRGNTYDMTSLSPGEVHFLPERAVAPLAPLRAELAARRPADDDLKTLWRRLLLLSSLFVIIIIYIYIYIYIVVIITRPAWPPCSAARPTYAGRLHAIVRQQLGNRNMWWLSDGQPKAGRLARNTPVLRLSCFVMTSHQHTCSINSYASNLYDL